MERELARYKERNIEDMAPLGRNASTPRGYKHPAPNGATFEATPRRSLPLGVRRQAQRDGALECNRVLVRLVDRLDRSTKHTK